MYITELHSFQALTLSMTTVSYNVKWLDTPENSKKKIGQILHGWARQDILSYLEESTIHKPQSEKLDFIKLKAFSHQKLSLIRQ